MTAQQKRFNVLLLGDACLDYFILVHDYRTNPEYDAPLYTEVSRFIVGGMARNVLRALDNLNIKVSAKFPGELSDKIRIIDHETGKQYCRLDVERQAQPLDISDVIFGDYDAVVVSDYCKGAITNELLHYISDNFKGPKFLDTKKLDVMGFKDWILKINSNEYKATGKLVPDRTIITHGEDGAQYIRMNKSRWFKSLDVDVVDVCGAGDSFLAGLVYGYLHNISKEDNFPLHNAIPYAICNSGLSVTKRGTYNPTEEELLKAYKDYDDK